MVEKIWRLSQKIVSLSPKKAFMSIKEYRLTSMEEPSDEILHELMEQVAESARKSSANAKRVLQKKMQETIALIHSQKQVGVF